MDPPRVQHPFCKALKAAEKPLILYGSAVLERDDAASIVKVLKSLNAQTKVREKRSRVCVYVGSAGGGGEQARVRGTNAADTSWRRASKTSPLVRHEVMVGERPERSRDGGKHNFGR